MQKYYYLYILTNKNNRVLYIGITNNLKRRIYQHKNKLIDDFTKKYNLSKLIYYEWNDNINVVIEKEKQMKFWRRDWKIELINKNNLKWNDLSKEI